MNGMKKGLAWILTLAMTAGTVISAPGTAAQATGSPVSSSTSTGSYSAASLGYDGERKLEFNEDWKFILSDLDGCESMSYNDDSWKSVRLPHDWSIYEPYTQSVPPNAGSLPGGTGWYRKSFTAPAALADKKVSIQFDGVYMISDVYINEHHLGTQYLGYTTFRYDITEYLNPGERNVIAVKVVSKTPNSRFYAGAGIYRNVWLNVTDNIHVSDDGVYITTPKEGITTESAAVKVQTDVSNDTAASVDLTLRSTVYHKKDGDVATVETADITIPANGKQTIEQTVNVPDPKLWSTTSPNLYYMRTEVLSGEEFVDTLDTRFGIRYIEMVAGDNDQGGKLQHGFYLNGERVQLQGVCMHSDLGSLGMEVNQAAIDRQIRILKSFGVNAIRGSHNPVSPEYVEACDRMGILLQEEAFDCWEQGKNTYDYSNYFTENHKRDIEAMVQRDKNAPSVIMWSIGNEISESSSWWGLDMGKTLMKYVKDIDDSRIVTAAVPTWANYGEETQQHLAMLDMAGFNYKEEKYDDFHWKYPNKVIYGAETVSSQYSRGIYFQGGTTRQDNQCSSYGGSWNFNSPQYSLEMVRDRPWVAGEFVWTGFDFIGEPNPYGWPSKSSYWGIVDTCGFPKDVYYLYKSMWQPEVDTVHLVPQNWNHQIGDKIRIQLHTNAASVELFLNGKSLGVRNHDIYKPGTQVTIEWGSIDFEPGELKAVAKDKDGNVIATDAVYTAGEPAAITLSPDRTMIKADGKDLVFVEATVVDSKGNMCPTADDRIFFEATGGKIISVDNGNAVDHDPYRSDNRKAFSGKALVLVAADSVGDITITARASTDGDPIGSNAVTVEAVNDFTQDADEIISMVESTIVVEKGSTATAIDILPKTVEIVYGNGVIERSTVTWTIPDDIDFSELGSFRIEGAVTGVDRKAICVIQVKELASAEDVTVMTYTKSAPMMPTFVPATYTDGSSGAADVIWEEIDPEQYAEAGTFTVAGTLAANPAIAVTAHVTVKDIVHYDSVSAMTTVGTLPTMPSTIEITLDDNTTQTVNVWWSVSDADVKYSGTTQVTGIIAGTNFEVNATLTVMLERYVSDLEWVSATQDGLPGKRVSVDKAINGDTLMSRNPQGGPPRAHEKGFGTAANSEIVYNISGQGYDRFQAYCSLHFITQEDKGAINFKVFLDNAATPAYESGPMTYASTRAFIDVDISRASKIRLVTEHVGDGPKADDLGNWCDAKFLSEHIALSEIVDDNYFTITEIGRTPGLPATVTAHTKDGAVAQFRVEWELDETDFATAGGKVVQGNIVGTNATMTANIIVDFDAVVADPSLAANITSYRRTDRFEYTDIADKHTMTSELLGSDTLITDFSDNMLVEVVNNYSLENVIYPKDGPGYVVYRGLDIKSFELRSAAREDGSERFNIYTSSDGETFTLYTDYTVIDSPPGDWHPKLHSSGPLPANTNYIKVEFPKNLDWKFNLNRITLSGGATAMVTGVTVPKSRLLVGFTGEIEAHVNTVNVTDETVTVKLLDAKGKLLSEATTNASGRADLPLTLSVTDPLPVGEYSVVASLSGTQGVKSTTITVTDLLPRDGWTATAHAYTEQYEGGKPEKAIDGDTNTRWADGRQQDGAEGRWFQIDMGKNQDVGAISIDARAAANDYGRKYNVYTRPDGSTEDDWVCVKSNVSINDPYQMITFPGVTARYIRVDQIGATQTGCWWSINEFNAYGCILAAADHHTVTISSMDNGTVTADVDSAEAGETVTLIIEPDAGYELSSISAHKTGEEMTDVALSGTGDTRTFSMPGHDVTVTAAFRKTADQVAVEAAKALVEGGTYTVVQALANSQDDVKAWLESELASLSSMDGIELEITFSAFTAAVADADEEATGSDGAYTFAVALTKGESTVTTESLTGAIVKTPYTPPGQTAAPVFTTRTQTFADEAANTVTFTLVGGTAETYTVYDAEAEGNALSDPAVAAAGAELTLTFTVLPVEAATYYISATEQDKTESTRTAVTVKPYEAPKSGEKMILSFTIEGQEGETSIDQGEHTIAVTMPEGTVLTALTPTITVSAAATVTPASGAEQNFSTSVTYTVTAEDGTTQAYTVTVTEKEPAPSTPDTTPIDAAVEAAESAKSGISVNDNAPSSVSDGTRFVTTAVMETLKAAIQSAKDAKLTVETDAEVEEVVATLNAAVTAFESAIQEGTYVAPSGGGSSNNNTSTETVKNEDGSTTTTVTNKKTGTVTETTKHPDGTTQVVETKKDGSMTSAETRKDGTKVESATTAEGVTTATVTLPKDADKVTVTIPTASKPKAGEVAVMIREDGTREIVKSSVSTETGMKVTLPEGGKLEIIDNSKTFEDVSKDAWYADAVAFAGSRELFQGTGGRFAPEDHMTRAMLMTVLYRFEGTSIQSGGPEWYSDALTWSVEAGISDGSNPEGEVTREQLAVILYRHSGSPKLSGMELSEFGDAENISDWATDAMLWAVSTGIIGGKSGNALDPTGTASRAEVATMLQRFVENLR